MASRFITYCDMFNHHFKLYRWDTSPQARQYLSGLLGNAPRKNMECIEADVKGANYQSLQQFLSDSVWNHRAVMEQVAQMAHDTLGNHHDCALYIDETSFVKKGIMSVGVKRQYCGRLGKIENCQVGVFAALGRADRAALTDFRLFLPEDWAADAARCDKCKVPEKERVHRTKPELALEMVRAARARGSTHQWIGADEAYGNNREFTDILDDEGETFLMDVSSTTHVWTQPPQFEPVAQPVGANDGKAIMGRPRKHERLDENGPGAVEVRELVAESFEAQSREIMVRQTTRGALKYRIWVCKVWTCDRIGHKARQRLLVARLEGDGTYKYSLSNAPEGTALERLAYMQGQRFWIEQAFADAKGSLGMAQYEVRGWTGWHHHMTLVCMAMLFTLRERIACKEDAPLLSVRDVVDLLDFYLPRQPRDEAGVIKRMKRRHEARNRDIERRCRDDVLLTK
jgi:SRSO17 transposase